MRAGVTVGLLWAGAIGYGQYANLYLPATQYADSITNSTQILVMLFRIVNTTTES